MAAPPPVAHDGNRIVDRDMWLACATPNSGRLPAVGSVVFYFVDGHAAQFCQFPAPLLEQLAVPGPRVFLCTVAAVRLRAYADITLDPVADHDVPATRAHAPAVPAAGGEQQQQLRYFVKTLMSSDADHRDRFAAPMDVAKDVFPPLVDAKAVPSRISDDVRIWQEGQERQRVTLSKVWKKFRDIVWDGNSEMNMSVNFWQVRPAEKVDISPSTPPKRLKNCEIDTAATSVSVDNADEQVPTTRQRLEALFPDNI